MVTDTANIPNHFPLNSFPTLNDYNAVQSVSKLKTTSLSEYSSALLHKTDSLYKTRDKKQLICDSNHFKVSVYQVLSCLHYQDTENAHEGLTFYHLCKLSTDKARKQ